MMAQWVKNSPAVQKTPEMWVRSLGWKDSLEEMATHSSILAWKIPWTEEPGGLQSMGSQRVRHSRKEHDHDTTEWYNMKKKKHVTHRKKSSQTETNPKMSWLMQCGVHMAGRRNPAAITSSFCLLGEDSCSRVTISLKSRCRANP